MRACCAKTRFQIVGATAAILLLQITSSAQTPKTAPPVAPGEKADILFAVSAPNSPRDEQGKPALASLDPIAFLVNGELRECYTLNATPNEDPTPKTTLDNLGKAYKMGHSYPVWWGGAPWGRSESVKSCIDHDLDLTGCAKLQPNDAKVRVSPEFSGTAVTYTSPKPTHPAVRIHASKEERALFLQIAANLYADRHIHIAPASIHPDAIWKTQLQAGHTALVGNTLVQFPLKEDRKWNSVRLFLALEESDGHYVPVLTQVHKTTIYLEADMSTPKIGEILEEENGVDRETFLDNFPLYPSEPDSIISRHQYYEDWSYSIYRRRGTMYQLAYTGCGGGD
jgi:hypothetical protein